MAKKLKDTDYLFISTYLHSRERDLLTGARMERMIEAPTAADAAKVLGEIRRSCSRISTASSPTRRWWMCSRSSMIITT